MSADDLSVKMVVSEAHLSKQSLYNNYYGLLGAIEELIKDIMSDAATEQVGACNWSGQIGAIMDKFSEEKEFFIHLYFSKYREDLIKVISESARPNIEKCILTYAEETGITLDDHSREMLVSIYMDIYLGEIRRYFDSRMADDPAHVIQTYACILNGMTKSMIVKLNQLSN